MEIFDPSATPAMKGKTSPRPESDLSNSLKFAHPYHFSSTTETVEKDTKSLKPRALCLRLQDFVLEGKLGHSQRWGPITKSYLFQEA